MGLIRGVIGRKFCRLLASNVHRLYLAHDSRVPVYDLQEFVVKFNVLRRTEVCELRISSDNGG